MIAPTRPAPVAVDDLDTRLALVGATMTAKLDQAGLMYDVNSSAIEIPVVPLTPSLQPEPATHHAPVAQLLRQARTLIAAGWTRGVYLDGRGGYCLQGALAAADTTGHAAKASHLLLEVIAAEQPHVEGLSRWNDQQTTVAPVLRAVDNAIHLADQRGL